MIPSFAINHSTAPSLHWQELVALAARLGCGGIELRNDLAGPLFDGTAPEDVAIVCQNEGIRLIALAELYGFTDPTPQRLNELAELARTARKAQAGGVALIPQVDGGPVGFDELCEALHKVGHILAEEGMRGLIEPVGFAKSALRDAGLARRAIAATCGSAGFGLIHDTFHHHLADPLGQLPVCADYVEVIHISSVEARMSASELQDDVRELVTPEDRLGTVAQLRGLSRQGCRAPASFEAFAPPVQNSNAIESDLRNSLSFLADALVHGDEVALSGVPVSCGVSGHA